MRDDVEQPVDRDSVVKETKLFRAKVARHKRANDQSSEHADDTIAAQPANIAERLDYASLLTNSIKQVHRALGHWGVDCCRFHELDKTDYRGRTGTRGPCFEGRVGLPPPLAPIRRQVDGASATLLAIVSAIITISTASRIRRLAAKGEKKISQKKDRKNHI